MLAHAARLAVIVVIFGACSPGPEEHATHGSAQRPVDVPPEIAELATDALRAASDVKVSGDIDAVLREHPFSPRYTSAMMQHFELMRELHRVAFEARIRYPRYALQVRHDQFCEDAHTAKLVVTTVVRYDMEAIPPAAGSPPYTAGQEEHVFRFERHDDGTWVIANHHEINLGEMHQKEVVTRLRNPCGSAQ